MSPKPPPTPKFKEKLWTRLEPIVLILVSDIVLFLIVLAGLVIAYTGISGLRALGMRPERLDILDTIHAYAYLGVSVIFLLDMVVRSFIEVARRR